jgi:integrase
MEHNETEKTVKKDRSHNRSTYQKVIDSRKRKVPGLWMRHGAFYAQVRISKAGGASVPCKMRLTATNLDEAKAELEKIKVGNRDGTLHTPGHRPLLKELVEQYEQSAVFFSKKIRTRASESQALARWVAAYGKKRIDWITVSDISAYRDKRMKKGTSARTINLDVIALRNVLKYAVDQSWIPALPILKPLKTSPAPRRPLLTREQINTVLDAAQVSKNCDQFRLFVRFLLATGAREQEALSVRREDADMEREVVRIGADGDTKNREGREVQFNAALRSVVTDIMQMLPPDCSFLFPSPQRGKKDIRAKSFRETLHLVRKKTGLSWVGFHDFRHYFASTCVMAGIDYMTIAKWLGHKDGGVLVGKVYGHLNDDHQRKAAEKLTL